MSPTQVQGPKALGHPQLLSHVTSRELDGKQSSWDANQHPHGNRYKQGEDLAARLPRWACAYGILETTKTKTRRRSLVATVLGLHA